MAATSESLSSVHLDDPARWARLAKHLRKAGVFGLDSEFYGVDVRRQSCVGRARAHVWSVATRTASLHPLGFHRARGWVLPAAALDHPDLRSVLEDDSVRKCVHNQPVDDHTFANHGVRLRGCVNTLGLARWAWPELVTAGGFGLKNLMSVKLRRDPICGFVDVVNDTRDIEVHKTVVVVRRVCSCGEEGCRRRKGHLKHEVESVMIKVTGKTEKYQHPLESIVPGHPRWELLVRYAGEDAVAALEIEELAGAQNNPAPWPYKSNGRPGFSQGVEDEVVLMEREGFPVDTEEATRKAVIAVADEESELAWLHLWYVTNAPTQGPHRRAEVDPIWSSPKQKAELFDALGFPASPVWKKGRVKPGEVKMDGAAMEWISRNHPPARQLLKHLLHLQRVRSGMKYLVKIRDCGGWVNPICGPAGDNDDRNGAITGRLGIKGVLEAQQLPSREEADLYQIRKLIVA